MSALLDINGCYMRDMTESDRREIRHPGQHPGRSTSNAEPCQVDLERIRDDGLTRNTGCATIQTSINTRSPYARC